MIKKTITYTDYDGVERTETFYFNLSKSELVRLNFGTDAGLDALVRKIQEAPNTSRVYEIFERIIGLAFGEKSEDGRRIIKSEEATKAFKETPAYDELILELLQNEEYAAEFVKGMLPSDLQGKVAAVGTKD